MWEDEDRAARFAPDTLPNQRYLRHRATGKTQILARSHHGTPINSPRFRAKLSQDGKRAVFLRDRELVVRQDLP